MEAMTSVPVRSSATLVAPTNTHEAEFSVEAPFRVEAGPGAGKTHWLIEHVKRTLVEGRRIHNRAYIVCITYTQVGADEIQRRLSGHSDRVWVSTIHSFLYLHLVRPYSHWLNIEGLKTSSFEGHGLLRPSNSQGMKFLEDLGLHRKQWFQFPQLAVNLETALKWTLNDEGKWLLQFSDSSRWDGVGGVKPKDKFNDARALEEYKKTHWQNGRIDHDDVIYLAHRLLKEHPGLSAALASRFPYVFLDEYQDTTPAQAELVEMLSNAGATVGGIGDMAQSIFGFTGAGPEPYKRFNPPGCISRKLQDNFRSSAPIVNVINHYRMVDDIQQASVCQPRLEFSTPPRPCVFVGSLAEAHAEACQRTGGRELVLLGREHDHVTELVRTAGGRNTGEIPWDDITKADRERANMLAALCRAFRRREEGALSLALSELAPLWGSGGHPKGPFSLKDSPLSVLQRRMLSVLLLDEVGDAVLRGATGLGTYEALQQRVDREASYVRLKRCSPNTKFAKAADVPLRALVDSVKMEATSGLARTFHSFKGGEAEAVFIYIKGKQLLQALLEPNEEENTRLLYVALSRARTHLFVAVQELKPGAGEALAKIGFEVVYLKSAVHVPQVRRKTLSSATSRSSTRNIGLFD